MCGGCTASSRLPAREAIDNLMVYLRAALPQVRRSASTLGEEFELAQAYLQLFGVRMGARLRFTLDLPPALRALPFPPMVLLTLVENAIKHGLAPADLGGTVRIAARVAGAGARGQRQRRRCRLRRRRAAAAVSGWSTSGGSLRPGSVTARRCRSNSAARRCRRADRAAVAAAPADAPRRVAAGLA